MRRLQRHHELIRAGSYLAGGYLSLIGVLCIVLLFLLMRQSRYPEPKLNFTFWQAIFWQAALYIFLGLGGLLVVKPFLGIIITIEILVSLLVAYLEIQRGVRLPVLHELADMILGKKHHK